MALIKCPECGREISDKAPACIYCGLPLKEYIPNTENVFSINDIDIKNEVDKVVKQFENYRLREAAFYYQTSKETYKAFFEDVSLELIQQVLSSNDGKLDDYEPINFVVKCVKKVEFLCNQSQNYNQYENYVIEVSNLMKKSRYDFFPFGCWTYWLMNLNYDKLKKEVLMQLAKIIARGNFTVWTKGELNVLFTKLTYAEKTECMEYWGEKYNSSAWKVNSEALYNCWLEYKRNGQKFDVNDISKYKGTDTGNIILPEIARKKAVENNVPRCPTCQSTNIKKISGISKVGSAFLWGVFSVGKISKQWHCKNCGSEW